MWNMKIREIIKNCDLSIGIFPKISQVHALIEAFPNRY